MATITIAKKHRLSHKNAKEAAQHIADDLAKRFDLRCEWHAKANCPGLHSVSVR